MRSSFCVAEAEAALHEGGEGVVWVSAAPQANQVAAAAAETTWAKIFDINRYWQDFDLCFSCYFAHQR